MRRLAGLMMLASSLGSAWASEQPSVPDRTQLEQVNGAAAMSWVGAENARTMNSLQSDPRYAKFYRDVLNVEQSPARLAMPTQMGGVIGNFWQDAAHPRGIWRQTSVASFNAATPSWHTLLDVDALAKSENADWVFQGAECLEPTALRCLVRLSAAGEDANTLREFDRHAGRFVEGGFALPRSKQSVAWVDDKTILIARDWSGDHPSLTRSGYPFIVKLLQRGQKLVDAHEITRGNPDDMSVSPESLRDERGQQLLLIKRDVNFFETDYSVFDPKTLVLKPLALPKHIGYVGYYHSRLILRLDQDWAPDAAHPFLQGSVVAVDPLTPEHAPQAVFVPSKSQATGEIDITAKGIIAVVYDNVQPHIAIFNWDESGQAWRQKPVPLPRNVSATIASASVDSPHAFLRVEGYIEPPQLWDVDTAALSATKIHATTDLFDASKLTTEQFWAKSTDGTEVPYFVVHRRDWPLNGHNPTLFTAYGGFDLSYLPTYYPDLGKTWFERGGVYVVGNIRGGGEFGPAWHEAGRKSGRQRAYDDFASIARDLFARHVTDAEHLGIRGRSNGGLLMGVEFTQHPELWRAVIIGVPLLDMLNFEHMAAGASWAAEYGSAANPKERPFLETISPLQRLNGNVAYPTPFIFTSTKDDRVGPVHARLFAARLEQLQKPFYYYEDTEGGHAGTVNATEVAHERALEAVYLSHALMDNAPIP